MSKIFPLTLFQGIDKLPPVTVPHKPLEWEGEDPPKIPGHDYEMWVPADSDEEARVARVARKWKGKGKKSSKGKKGKKDKSDKDTEEEGESGQA